VRRHAFQLAPERIVGGLADPILLDHAREPVRMAAGFQAVCAFVTDELDAATLSTLADGGAQSIALYLGLGHPYQHVTRIYLCMIQRSALTA
jgi:hypothetical protein